MVPCRWGMRAMEGVGERVEPVLKSEGAAAEGSMQLRRASAKCGVGWAPQTWLQSLIPNKNRKPPSQWEMSQCPPVWKLTQA